MTASAHPDCHGQGHHGSPRSPKANTQSLDRLFTTQYVGCVQVKTANACTSGAAPPHHADAAERASQPRPQAGHMLGALTICSLHCHWLALPPAVLSLTTRVHATCWLSRQQLSVPAAISSASCLAVCVACCKARRRCCCKGPKPAAHQHDSASRAPEMGAMLVQGSSICMDKALGAGAPQDAPAPPGHAPGGSSATQQQPGRA